MPNLIDLTGMRFDRLLVLGRADSRNGRTMWKCQCDCGNTVIVGGKDMKSGKTKSCGCYHKDHLHLPPVMRGEQNPSYKHGSTGTKLYFVWASMIQRCTNKNNKGFSRYGARGISVCDEWRDSSAFIEWALANGYRDGLSIDRIDNDGNYCPENCRWVDSETQSNNRRCNIIVSRGGETHTLSEWARIKNLPYKVVLARYYRNGDNYKLFSEVKR